MPRRLQYIKERNTIFVLRGVNVLSIRIRRNFFPINNRLFLPGLFTSYLILSWLFFTWVHNQVCFLRSCCLSTPQVSLFQFISNSSSFGWLNPTTTLSSTSITGTAICPDFCISSRAFSRSLVTLYSVKVIPLRERYSFARWHHGQVLVVYTTTFFWVLSDIATSKYLLLIF